MHLQSPFPASVGLSLPYPIPPDAKKKRAPSSLGELLQEIYGVDVSEWEIKREGPDLVGRGYVKK